jgi:hypothetical protein
MPGKSFYPVNYYHLYLEAAWKFKNPLFAEMADRIYESALRSGRGVPGALWLYMTDEGLKDFEPELKGLPENYEVFYEPSGIVRRRNGDMVVTLLAGSPNFLFVQKGSLRCYVRMCASFFAVAQFKGGKLEKNQNGYSMDFTAVGSYKMPFDQPPGTSVWDSMDHSKRHYVNRMTLTFSTEFRFTGEGVEMKVATRGCDRVPMKMDFCFTGGCKIKGENFMVEGLPGNGMIAGSGKVGASLGTDRMEIGPAFMAHSYAADMRGSMPVDKSAYTVYFTAFTNVEKTIEIRTYKGEK